MAGLIQGTSIVVPSTGGGRGSENDTKFRNYLEGANANGPATLMTIVNCPKTNTPGSGTIVVGVDASPVIYAYRYAVDYACTLKSLSVNITVAATDTWRAGVYEANGDGDILPGALLADSGSLATNPAGTRTATIDQILEVGLYWFVISFDNSAGSTIAVHDATRMENLGVDATLTHITGITRTRANEAALPDPWGSTFTLYSLQMPSLYAAFEV